MPELIPFAEYIDWAKGRALACVDRGEFESALWSMYSDLHKYDPDHICLGLVGNHINKKDLTTPDLVREFINGFN